MALQAYAMDAIMLRIRDDIGGEWNRVSFDTDFGEGGRMTVATRVRRLGDIALAVDADVLERAGRQMDSSTGEPTPTATPVPTATAAPTTTPGPTPPSTLPDPPVTGGSPVQFEMLLALIGAAVLMIIIGVRVLTRT